MLIIFRYHLTYIRKHEDFQIVSPFLLERERERERERDRQTDRQTDKLFSFFFLL